MNSRNPGPPARVEGVAASGRWLHFRGSKFSAVSAGRAPFWHFRCKKEVKIVFVPPRCPKSSQMSSVETGQVSAVETGKMSAAETGQVSAVETRQMLQLGFPAAMGLVQSQAKSRSWLTKVPVEAKSIKFDSKWVENRLFDMKLGPNES